MEFSGESSSQRESTAHRAAWLTPIRRAYWTIYRESAREVVRVRTVVAFLQELVTAERQIFVRHA